MGIETEVRDVLAQLDELAELWGDEGKFRRCRDRLRAATAGAADDDLPADAEWALTLPGATRHPVDPRFARVPLESTAAHTEWSHRWLLVGGGGTVDACEDNPEGGQMVALAGDVTRGRFRALAMNVVPLIAADGFVDTIPTVRALAAMGAAGSKACDEAQEALASYADAIGVAESDISFAIGGPIPVPAPAGHGRKPKAAAKAGRK